MVFVAELGLPTGVSPKVALLVAGSVAVDSRPELLGALALVTVANLIGSVLLHALARSGGTRLVGRLLGKHPALGGAALERWRGRLGGHDAAAVGVGRVVPLVRLYIPVAAGLLRIRWRDYLIGAAPAALIWSGAPLALGYLFRSDVERFTAGSSTASRLFFLAVPLFGVVLAAAWWVRGGATGWQRVQRGRVVLSGLAALGAAAWVTRAVRGGAWAEAGAIGSSLFVVVALIALAATTLLLAAAVADARGSPLPSWRWPLRLGATAGLVVWLATLGVLAGGVTGIALRYPGI